MSSPPPSVPSPEIHYIPTPEDIYTVRSELHAFVPAEIASLIVEAAEYWPKAVARVEIDKAYHGGHLMITQEHSPQCFLVTPQLNVWTGIEEGNFKPRQIKFKIRSHDQGWTTDDISGYTTQYMGSRTWYEAVIIRDFKKSEGEDNNNPSIIRSTLGALIQSINTRAPRILVQFNLEKTSHELESKYGTVTTVENPADKTDVWHIQRNIRASGTDAVHEVVWTDQDPTADNTAEMKSRDTTGTGKGTGFIQNLNNTDRIAVIGRALYVGWQNHINSIEIEMAYSV